MKQAASLPTGEEPARPAPDTTAAELELIKHALTNTFRQSLKAMAKDFVSASNESAKSALHAAAEAKKAAVPKPAPPAPKPQPSGIRPRLLLLPALVVLLMSVPVIGIFLPVRG